MNTSIPMRIVVTIKNETMSMSRISEVSLLNTMKLAIICILIIKNVTVKISDLLLLFKKDKPSLNRFIFKNKEIKNIIMQECMNTLMIKNILLSSSEPIITYRRNIVKI